MRFLCTYKYCKIFEKYPRHFFQSLFSLPKYSLSYPTQNSDTKNFCVDMLGGLHFEGRQKKATPSPMCAIHFCIGYSSSVAQFYREKIKYTNIANKFLKTNGYLDFIHWDTFSHYTTINIQYLLNIDIMIYLWSN